MNDTLRALLAEAVGTFVFFTIGMGAVVVGTRVEPGVGPLAIAFAHGVALAVMVTVFGRVSGGHFNPAVTIGVWAGGKITSVLAVLYVAAQLLGGVAAGFLLRLFFARAQWEPSRLGAPALGGGVSIGQAVMIEAVLTAFLLLAVWGTGVDPRGPKVAGFAIGLAVFMGILVGGPLTGAALNPARAFAPAVAANFWQDQWVYWVGPAAGAIVASLLYRTVFYREEHPEEVQTVIAHDRDTGRAHDLPDERDDRS